MVTQKVFSTIVQSQFPNSLVFSIQYSCLKYKMKTVFLHFGAETQFRLNPALISFHCKLPKDFKLNC